MIQRHAALLEMQKTLGEIQSSIRHLTQVTEGNQAKLETLGEMQTSIRHLTQVTESSKTKLEDLLRWKHMILGGTATLGFLLAIIFALIKLLKP